MGGGDLSGNVEKENTSKEFYRATYKSPTDQHEIHIRSQNEIHPTIYDDITKKKMYETRLCGINSGRGAEECDTCNKKKPETQGKTIHAYAVSSAITNLKPVIIHKI